MFQSLVILPLVILTVQATGKFSILEYPNSLEFKGKDKLDSIFVGDVLGAALGQYIDTESHWGGLYINDPFDLPKGVINFLIVGVNEINLNQKAKSFSLYGSDSRDSLNILSSTLEITASPVVSLDLNKGVDSLLTYTDLLGNVQILSTTKSTNHLKPDSYPADKLFLQQVAAINALANKISEVGNKPSLINIELSLRPLIDSHGADSPAIAEALKTLTESITNFAEISRKAYGDELLFTVVTDSSMEPTLRQKRAAAEENSKENPLNIAAHYDEDYPVIFNIILWFMVILAFSLLAISYAIGGMDPGRDSIIYRMTSTRMKKDN